MKSTVGFRGNLMLKGASCLVVLLTLIAMISSASAQSVQIINGLNYLMTNQNPDGSWGGTDTSINTTFYSTAVSIETLKILNETNTQAYTNGVQWLSNYTVDNTGYIAWRILALTGENIDLSSDLNLLIQWQNEDEGWGGDADSTSMINDTALALQALKAVNYSDQTVIQSALDYLLLTQNTDGGFGFYQGDDSNVYMTAMGSMTLQQFSQTPTLATAINKATSYLIAHQNQDGGFGSSTGSGSTVYETALAYIALVGVTTDNTVLGNAINYLINTQMPNGSWLQDPYSTALALRALANVKPNLSISSNDIVFSNPAPTVGDTITITANIKNTGPSQADNILIQFFDGDPSTGGIFIGEATISSIPAYSSASATISWTIPEASTKVIFVKIDPSNTIDELKESDNVAYKNLATATLPDLSITGADITISPSAPEPNTQVNVFINIRNQGESDASNVLVNVYDGDPASGGTLISESVISSITAYSKKSC